VLASADGEREVRLSDYFTGYRQTVRRADELIKTVRIPTPLAPIASFHKIAKRRFDDISSAAVAFALRLGSDDGRPVVAEVKIGLGGVAATPIRAYATEESLTGQPWSAEAVAEAAQVMGGEGTPLNDHRGSADYRAAMLRTALLKFHAQNPDQTYSEV
jgi:xanthine dehydrogenase small subunit